MKCDDCGGPAKPLFTGKFCVRDCPARKPDANGEIDWSDLWDEPTKPGVYPLHSTPCKHSHVTFATHGNVTGMWCKDCGKLMSTP